MATGKELTDVKKFVENVNKKDKVNGTRIRFKFVRRKKK
jgi:hypothetical protein